MSIFKARSHRLGAIGVCAFAFLSFVFGSISLSAKDGEKSTGSAGVSLAYGGGASVGYSFGNGILDSFWVCVDLGNSGISGELDGKCSFAAWDDDKKKDKVNVDDCDSYGCAVKYKLDSSFAYMVSAGLGVKFGSFYLEGGPILGIMYFNALAHDKDGKEHDKYDVYDKKYRSIGFGLSVRAGYRFNDAVSLFGRLDWLFTGSTKERKNSAVEIKQRDKALESVPCDFSLKTNGPRLTVGVELRYKARSGFFVGGRGFIGASWLSGKLADEKKEEKKQVAQGSSGSGSSQGSGTPRSVH